MGSKLEIKEGQVFGKLTVIKEVEPTYYNKRNLRNVLCKCECGNEKIILYRSVINNITKSCGCLQKDGNKKFEKHGMYNSSEFRTWVNIKQRCYNINTPYYINYGERGIKVCNRWLESFENFYEDMGPKPTPYHSIDRINNDGNYEPSNCKWATKKEQQNNTRRNKCK
jgi:hypothetical protein